MNKFIGVGTWVRNQDVIYTQGEKPVAIANCCMAFNRVNGDADFVNTVAFGKTAEFLEKYASKGQKMAIEGRLQVDSYENKEGKKIYSTKIAIERVEFVGAKSDQSIHKEEESKDGKFLDIPEGLDEELPFT